MGLFSEITESFKELKDDSDEVRENLLRVQQEADKAKKVTQDIKTKVQEFQFSIAGNLSVINDISQKYQPQANDSKKTTPSS